jgi:hypothetical protein
MARDPRGRGMAMSRKFVLAVLVLMALAMFAGDVMWGAPAVAPVPAAAPAPASAPAVPAAPGAGAPSQAKGVYRSNFAAGGGLEWWPRWTETTPVGGRAFLGQFGIEPATFTLRNLPAHKFVRLHVSLFQLEPSDGSSPIWGPDVWEMRVLGGGPRLVYSTFDNCGFFTNNNEQAFPDDFPWAVHRGWTGIKERENLGFVRPFNNGALPKDCSSVYDMTLVFPHDGKDLRLLLRALWTETQKKWGESWGLESLRVEVLDGPVPVPEKELENLWADLDGQDPAPAFAALWKLVGAGPQSVDFIKGKIGKPVLPRQTPAAPKPEEEFNRLLKEMDDASFQTREKATERLIEIGRSLLGQMEAAAQTADSPEVRIRLRRAIDQVKKQQVVEKAPRAPQDLLGPRAAKVLEMIGGPAALDLLDNLSCLKDPKMAPFAAASRQRLAERMLDELLERADDAGLAEDVKTVEDFCAQARKLAKTYLPDDEPRAVAALEACHQRAKARTAPLAVEGEAARREAMRLRLAVADDPAGAAKLADDAKDRAALTLAAKPVETLTETEAATLRAFCLKHARSADGTILPGMIGRALAVARPDGKPTEKGFDPTEGIERDLLVAWAADQAARGRWTDVLPLLNLPPLIQGQAQDWVPEWSGVRTNGGQTPLHLAVQPAGSYQLRLQLLPVGMNSTVVWLPVGDRHVQVNLFANGEVSIIGPLQKPPEAVLGKWLAGPMPAAGEYLIDLTVRQDAAGGVEVLVSADGRPAATWKGKVADLLKGAPGAPPPGIPSVLYQGDWALLRSAWVRMLGGKAKFDSIQQPTRVAPPEGGPVIELEIDAF